MHRGGRSYASRDYLCLDCIVPGDCSPASVLCLWRADRRRRGDEGQLELLSAVDQLAVWRPAPAAEVARLLGIAPSTLGPQLRRALEAGFLAQHAPEGRPSGVCLTPLGRGRLAELLDDRPELELSPHQRSCYGLLAAVRDLQSLGRVTASRLGRALRRDERNIAARLRRLSELGLVAYDFGHVVLTDAGHHLLATLQAYALNLRPGPRLLIRARGRYRVEILATPEETVMPPAPPKMPRPRPRAVDPALPGNLSEIALLAFEVGASVAYLVCDPQALFLRDDRGQPLVARPAATVLVLLFPCRAGGEPGIVEWEPGEVRPLLG